jgi:hypothetical protein
MDPRVIFGIAGGVLALSLPLLWLTRLPLLWSPVLSIGITFACAAWVSMRKYYPGRPGMWWIGTLLTLLPTLVALWVVHQAGTLANQLAVKRQDSDMRTEISAMLRDKPEDYPPMGEGLRQERLGRLSEIRRVTGLSPRTVEFTDKAIEFIEKKLPLERGFRYRVCTEARLRDAVGVLEKTPAGKVVDSLPFPAEGLLVLVEDRASLKPILGERYALADLYAMRGVALRAACGLDEAEWLALVTWDTPALQTDRYSYPCTLLLMRKRDGVWQDQSTLKVPQFALESEPDAEADTASARGFNLGERPRQDAIRRWLQGGQPGKLE